MYLCNVLLLISPSARQYFFDIVKETMQSQFKVSLDKVLKRLASPTGELKDDDIRGLFFGDYINANSDLRPYDEITDFEELTTVIET